MKNRSSRWWPWRHFEFPIGTILAIFYLHVISMLPVTFQVNWPFSLGEEQKQDFQSEGHLGFLIQMILAIFFIEKSPHCFLPSFKSIDLSVQEQKRKIDFQDSSHGSQGGHLGFPIRTILAILNLQVTPMLPTIFQVNCLFGSGEEAKNRFSR